MTEPRPPAGPGDPYDTPAGREAALRRWAKEPDPIAATARARAAFLERFERQVDPDGTMPAEERERRAHQLMRAHMISLARKRAAKRAAASLRRRTS